MGRLFSKGSSASEEYLHRFKVEFIKYRFVLCHGDDNGRDLYIMKRSASSSTKHGLCFSLHGICISELSLGDGVLAYKEECVDLESLDRVEEGAHLKFGKIDHLIASISSCMADDYQGINMALW